MEIKKGSYLYRCYQKMNYSSIEDATVCGIIWAGIACTITNVIAFSVLGIICVFAVGMIGFAIFETIFGLMYYFTTPESLWSTVTLFDGFHMLVVVVGMTILLVLSGFLAFRLPTILTPLCKTKIKIV